MIHGLKSFGTALVAVLATSSVLAASASADVVTSEAGSSVVTTVTGKQGIADVFTVDGGVVKCETNTYTGSFKSGTSSVELTPTYSNCTYLGLATIIDMNGCFYRGNIKAGSSTEGTVDIVCAAANEITVTASIFGIKKCIVHIPPQTGLIGAIGTNIGSGATREGPGDIKITNIKYSQTAGTAEAGNCKQQTAQPMVSTKVM